LKNLGHVEGYQLSIYNRWGETVFSSTNIADCWDGTYKGVPQNAGAFVYVLQGKSACGTLQQKGTIVLIR
jgi:gliding motility-associated-like protein